MLTPQLLEEFCLQLGTLCGLEQVSVLFYAEPLDRRNLMLSSYGEPVAELADVDSAWAFLAENPMPGTDRLVCLTRQAASGAGLCCLRLSDILSIMAGQRKPAERRATPVFHAAPLIDGCLWIGTRDMAGIQKVEALYRDIDRPSQGEGSTQLLHLTTKLVWSVYYLSQSLKDPVSQLPARMEFEVLTNRVCASAYAESQAFATLLVSADDFAMVNHRHGREDGDQAVMEIAHQLTRFVRSTDGVFRYAGAVFGLVLPATDFNSCQLVADKLHQRLGDARYLDGQLNLSFTIGGAVLEAETIAEQRLSAEDIVHRADSALNRAKLDGGNRVLISSMADPDEGLNHFDPLSGIFTTNAEKDYRNMSLLWESISLVATTPDPAKICDEFVRRVHQGFNPRQVVLFETDEQSALHVVAATGGNAEQQLSRGDTLALSPAATRLIETAIRSGDLEQSAATATATASGDVLVSYAVPLLANQRVLGCLYIDGGDDHFYLDPSDLNFLSALTQQMAVALDRSQLAARWAEEKEAESRQLRAEVRDLQQALTHSKLVYQSEQIEQLLTDLKRTAPSDATVLIFGESGTGKELIAQSVHDFSHRAEQAFVTVDCGAVSHNLLEAELFGHVKGAFTGASQASPGRILQAHGGTLFLDEIGELPLELQTKLLRFVQEKQITPVGGHQTRKVDVRIVAATNKDLSTEVSNGRFRQDLYYRLQVISVVVPPLRERMADVAPLAEFFVAKYARQYASKAQSIGDAALACLLEHSWPGNVRELQHCLVRAVLMAGGNSIQPEDLQLLPESNSPTVASQTQAPRLPASAEVPSTLPATAQASEQTDCVADHDVWNALQHGLRVQIQIALASEKAQPVPLGRWLGEDLILAMHETCGDVSRQAARLAGLPESTFRRRLTKLKSDQANAIYTRSGQWQVMGDILKNLVAEIVADGKHDHLLEEARTLLLDLVDAEVEGAIALGSALMGVTPPTYRRWLATRAA